PAIRHRCWRMPNPPHAEAPRSSPLARGRSTPSVWGRKGRGALDRAGGKSGRAEDARGVAQRGIDDLARGARRRVDQLLVPLLHALLELDGAPEDAAAEDQPRGVEERYRVRGREAEEGPDLVPERRRVGVAARHRGVEVAGVDLARVAAGELHGE